MSGEHTVTRAISHLLRRFPFIMRMPYLVYSRMQARYTIGVAAVIFDGAGRILLVEHAYHPRFAWGLPGGWTDKDEDPSSAVLRELSEELQLNARVLRVVHSSKTAPNHVDLAFHCEALSPIGKLSHELLDFHWVARDDLPEINRFHRQAINCASERIQGGKAWERV
ncbi:MAG: NUDIX hydrolase [Chloroflexi bacterium]|nr:NUDIX hydrolase [Chloroflexota bacterium]